MNLLFINSCVREQSRTLQLCETYMERFSDEWEIQEVNLQKENLIPFTDQMLSKRSEDIENLDYSDPGYQYAKDFAQADAVLVGAPYWDLSFPSSLKVYFEHICVNGITFGYTKAGLPAPMCRAKELIYITTCGGYIGAQNSAVQYIENLCSMFGIEQTRIYSAEGLDIAENNADQIMEETREKLRQQHLFPDSDF